MEPVQLWLQCIKHKPQELETLNQMLCNRHNVVLCGCIKLTVVKLLSDSVINIKRPWTL